MPKKLKNYAKIAMVALVICAPLLLTANCVFAESNTLQNLTNVGGKAGLGKGTSGSDGLINMIGDILNVVIGLLGVIFILYILWAGFMWMTAAGDEAKIKKAQDMIKAGIIGLIIIFASYAIAFFVIQQIATATGATV